jgi:hypothetical protein
VTLGLFLFDVEELGSHDAGLVLVCGHDIRHQTLDGKFGGKL